MKKFLAGILILALTFGAAAPAFAMGAEAVVDQQTEGAVTVTVTADQAAAGQLIMLEVLKKDKSFSDLRPDAPDTVTDSVAYLGQAVTDATGTAVFQLTLTQPMGRYLYRAADEYGAQYDGSFFLYTARDVENTVALLNDASEEDFLDRLSQRDTRDVLGLEAVRFSLFTADRQRAVLQMMYRECSRGTGDKTLEEFQQYFLQSVLIEQVRQSSTAGEIKRLVEDEPNGLRLSECGMFEVFAGSISVALQERVYGAMAGKSYDGLAQLHAAFDLYTLTQPIRYAGNWKEIGPVLKGADKALKLGLNWTEYQNLKDPTAVDKALVNKSYTTAAEVTKAFHDAVAAQAKKESAAGSRPSGSGSGGGGGGGGGNYPAIELPSVTPVPVEPVPGAGEDAAPSFEDLGDAGWARESILYLYNHGIVNGKEPNLFYPNDAVTREEFIKMLVESLDLLNPYAVCDFQDVTDGEWYYPYVSTAYELEIVNGVEPGRFGIGALITREDLAVMVGRALDYAKLRLESTVEKQDFTDEKEISAYARTAVEQLQRAGVISGKENRAFEPQASATRAETASILHRVLKAVEAVYTVKD